MTDHPELFALSQRLRDIGFLWNKAAADAADAATFLSQAKATCVKYDPAEQSRLALGRLDKAITEAVRASGAVNFDRIKKRKDAATPSPAAPEASAPSPDRPPPSSAG